jgi:cytosine deaminase
MDLILRNARVVGNESVTTDVGIDKARIAVIQPKLAAEGETLDLGGRLITPRFIETHIRLDKSRILGRCKAAPWPQHKQCWVDCRNART